MRLARVASFTAFFVVGPLALSASCSSGSATGALTPPPAAIDASTVDAREEPAPAACPVSASLAARCTGTDPSFTFFPPLVTSDASSSSVPYSDTGYFSAAACAAFVAQEATGSVVHGATANAPTWDFPNDGDAFPPDNWITFEWEQGPTGRNWILDAIEPSAHAAPPTSGDAYVLEFTQGCTEIARVMLTDLYWVPDPPTWARIVDAVGPITVTVTWVSFTNDAVAKPPVASAPVSFRIIPDDDAGDASAASGDDGSGDDASDANGDANSDANGDAE